MGSGPESEKTSAPIEIRESLEAFKKDYPDSSRMGFIMMRFSKTPTHDRILTGIRRALTQRGLVGVRSDDKQYHDDLFWNVITYAYGCDFGIAVFERIEVEEFNPNVSLEVGYMLALHKPVCLLKDNTLQKLHADLLGKLYKGFDSYDPERTIAVELPKWLADKNLEWAGTRKDLQWWQLIDWSRLPEAYEKLPVDIKSRIEARKV